MCSEALHRNVIAIYIIYIFARLTCFKRRFIKNERAKTILLIMLKYLLERFIDRATSSACADDVALSRWLYIYIYIYIIYIYIYIYISEDFEISLQCIQFLVYYWYHHCRSCLCSDSRLRSSCGYHQTVSEGYSNPKIFLNLETGVLSRLRKGLNQKKSE